MGLIKLIPEKDEKIKTNKKKLKEDYKKIDKKSNKIAELIKRIEILEQLMGLE